MNTSMVNLTSRKKTYITNLISSIILVIVVYLLFSGKFVNLPSSRYYSLILTVVCINIILTVSLNLSTGCLGEMVLGHAAFMAVGAYSAGIFLKAVNLNQILGFSSSLIVGFISAGIVGFIIGIPALRLKGDYLAIITLGFGEIIKNLAEVLQITGGSAGLKGIPNNTTLTYALIVVILVVALLFTYMRSRFGRSILSIREDDIAAEASGIPVTKYKVATFAFSAALAGVAGAMYAQNNGTIIPSNFNLDVSIEILVIVVLGGLGSFTGSILATIILITMPYLLSSLDDYRYVVYSILLIIIMLTKPDGLLGRYEFSMTRFIKKLVTLDIRLEFKKFVNNLKLFFKNFPKNLKNLIKKIPANVKRFFRRNGDAN